MTHACRGGYVLVMVLIIAGIGLLFGAGALLLFRYQCQLRIERQHELEKVYAVRSALNYIKAYTKATEIDATFGYYTGSDRALTLDVKPVSPVFPNPTNEHHFAIEKGQFESVHFSGDGKTTGYSGETGYDYEYAASAEVTNNPIRSVEESVTMFKFLDPDVPKGASCWLNIGMSGTQGWLHEPYGRRYYFHSYGIAGSNTYDCVRLYLIRKPEEKSRNGWPLLAGEKAIVFQLQPRANASAVITVSEQWGSEIVTNLISWSENIPFMNYMGIEISDRFVTAFYVENFGQGPEESHGYNFSEAKAMTYQMYEYFKKGCEMSDDGRINRSPELRAVLEVVANSTDRASEIRNSLLGSSHQNKISKFRVTPAYQYEIFIGGERFDTTLATVAQRMGEYQKRPKKFPTVLTYDTHGTENKGFRKDEREASDRR